MAINENLIVDIYRRGQWVYIFELFLFAGN